MRFHSSPDSRDSVSTALAGCSERLLLRVVAANALAAALAVVLLVWDSSHAQTNTPLIDVSPNSVRVLDDVKGGSEVVVSLTAGGDEGTFIAVRTVDGTAKHGEDYGNVSGTLKGGQQWLTPGNAEYIRIPITFDRMLEGEETFDLVVEVEAPNDTKLRFPDANGDGNPDTSVTVPITIYERATSLVAFGRSTSRSTEGEQISFSVQVVEGLRKGAVEYRVVPKVGTASPDNAQKTGQDYNPFSWTKLELDGRTDAGASKTFSVQTISDALIEDEETFQVELRIPKVGGGDLRLDQNRRTAIGIITDNNGTLNAQVSDVTVTEGEVAELTVSLPRALKAGESVAFQATSASGRDCGDTATPMAAEAQPAVDFRAIDAGEVVIMAGQQSVVFAIPTAADNVHEGTECFRALLTATRGILFPPKAGQAPPSKSLRALYPRVTITDDDPPPTFSFGRPEVVEGNPGGKTVKLRYPVRLDRAIALPVQVEYSDATAGITGSAIATAGADYQSQSGTLAFQSGVQERFIEITVVGDYIEEPDEEVWLRFQKPVNASIPSPLGVYFVKGTIINDDDDLDIGVTLDDDRVPEGEPLVYRVTISRPIQYDLVAKISVSGGTATKNADYNDPCGIFCVGGRKVTVHAGQTVGTLSVTTNADQVTGEGVESLTLALNSVEIERNATDQYGRPVKILARPADIERIFGTAAWSYSSVVARRIAMPTAYILDGPALSVTPLREKITEGGSLEFAITLDPPAATDVTFTVQTADGPSDQSGARAGADFTAIPAREVTIPAGETRAPSITVVTLQDAMDEPDQRLFVTLSGATGAVLDGVRAVGMIRDDDARPTLSVADTAANEGDDLSFTVSLSEFSDKEVTFHWLTEDVTAQTQDRDYHSVERRRSATIMPGQMSTTVVVKTIEDDESEPDETLRVQLLHATEAKFADPTAVGTIRNDDGIVFSIADAAPVTEGTSAATASFTVKMFPPQTKPVTIQWQTENGVGGTHEAARSNGDTTENTKPRFATNGWNDFTRVTNGRLTFAAGETQKQVNVTVLNDHKAEIEENFRATISSADPNIGFLRATAYGTIVDDDAHRIWVDEKVPLVITEGTGSDPTIQTITVRRTDTTAIDAGQGLRNKIYYAILICFITEVDKTKQEAAYKYHEYAGTASIPADAYLKVPGGSGRSSIRCHDRTTNEGAQDGGYLFNMDPGEYEKTFDLAIEADKIAEDNETVAIWLQTTTRDRQGFRHYLDPISQRGQIITFTILDDDSPQASISDVTIDEDGGNAELTINLSQAPKKPVRLDYRVADGTAQIWQDFTPRLENVTFAVGETSQTIHIGIVDDNLVEDAERFSVILENPSEGLNIHPNDGSATVTINKDDGDGRPHLTIPDRVVDEGDVATVLFKLDPPATGTWGNNNLISWYLESPANGPAATMTDDFRQIGGHRALPNGRISLTDGQALATRRITTVEDSVIEADEDIGVAVYFTHGESRAPTFDGAIAAFESGTRTGYAGPLALVTIRDDDHGSLSFSGLADAAVNENEQWTSPVPTASGNTMGDVSWTISGDDAALFTIDPDSGKLVLPEQNYEEPADQDEDNVYEVTVRATDEDGNARSQDIKVTVSDVTLGTFVVSVSECCSDDNARKVYGADEGAEILVLITATAEGSSAPMSIKLATASHDDGAHLAESDDYTATSPATFTWTETHLVLAKQDAARTKYFSFKVSTTQDNVLEEHETFMIVLSEGTAAGTDDVDFRFTSQSQNVISIDGNSAQAVVTIANDDVADLSIADATAVEGKDAWFKINLGAVLDKDIMVKWATSDDTTKDAAQATAGTDYKARTKAQTATITAGETTTRVRVKTKDDELDEDDETFMVVLSEPNSATLSADAIAIGTITDNDPVPQLSVADALVAEGGKAQFTVTLDPVSGRDVTVQWTTGDDPAQDAVQATAGDDYAAVSSAQTVTIKAGQARATIEVQTTDDELDEGDETFIVTLASPANAALAANPSATGTITDNDRTPELSVDDVTVKEGGKASFTVTLTSTPSQDVTVQWTTSDDTAQNAHSATADIDYTAAANAQTLTIKAGKRSAAIEVQTTQDALDEEDETFLVTLASPTNATLSADPSGKATISDDDDPPTASVRDAADVTEGDDPAVTTNMTFPVHLSAVSGKQVTVQYTLAGTATAGADYTDPATKSVTIAAGSQTADILIPIKGDEMDEPNEIIELTLSAPTNATLPQPADAEEELETSSQGGLEGGDGEDQSPSQDAESATASGTITDDDAAPSSATLTVSPTSVAEDAKTAATITVTATLGRTTTFSADKNITIKVGKSTDSAKSAVDYAAVADLALIISAGEHSGQKTFTLTPTNDALNEDNESLTVHGLSAGL
ncbi:MAG: hypothetical protein OXG27_12050, partial [Chloroflexi bacterium]|nr:hypothetical protein [Chloroflexota bacterium]